MEAMMTNETTRSASQPQPKTLDERRAEIRKALGEAVTALGHAWEEKPSSYGPPSVNVDGVPLWFEIAEEGRGYSARRAGTSRLRIKFGDYGDRHQYPEPKAGFDAKKIAAAISSMVRGNVQRRTASADLAARVGETRAIASAINTEIGQGHSAYATVSERSGSLMVKVDAFCTKEQARALLTAAKQILGTK